MLEHICVVLQFAFKGIYNKYIMNWSWFTENSNFVILPFPQMTFENGLGEAMCHQIYTVDTLSCYKDIYQS